MINFVLYNNRQNYELGGFGYLVCNLKNHYVFYPRLYTILHQLIIT